MGSYLSRNNFDQQIEQTEQLIKNNEELFNKIGRARTFNDWNQHRSFIQVHICDKVSLKHLIDIPMELIKQSLFYLPTSISLESNDTTDANFFTLEEFTKLFNIKPIMKLFLEFFRIEGVFTDENCIEDLLLVDYDLIKTVCPLIEFTFKIISQNNDCTDEIKIKQFINVMIQADKNKWLEMIMWRYVDETGNSITKEKYKLYYLDTIDFVVVTSKLMALYSFKHDGIPFEYFNENQHVFDFLKQKLFEFSDEMVSEGFFLINETRSKDTINWQDFVKSLSDKRIQTYFQTFTHLKFENFRKLLDDYVKRTSNSSTPLTGTSLNPTSLNDIIMTGVARK